jgi:RNA polymerase sigma-70 factor (ECF subfamily)
MTDAAERLYERLLVLRCQTGDGNAFTELVERYDRRLRYYLRKMLQETDRLDDLAQETWLDVFRSLPRLLEPGAFGAWFYRLARDRAYRELRKRSMPCRPLGEAELAVTNGAPDDFSAEDAARVHRALDDLEPEHREALVLRFLEEMSYEDIARVTACPLGTVRSRLHYAKRALRRALEAEHS